MAACVQKSRVESTYQGSRVKSRVEGLRMCLKVRKKQKPVPLEYFFPLFRTKKWIINNIVRASNEMLCQSSCVSTLEI